jgi:preprotein translocase subunit SecG
MTLFVTLIYFVVCLLLIVLVLMQHGKGADIGVSLGGGASNTVFGARGAGTFLTRVTTGSAILFMILAFGLARCSTTANENFLESTTPASAGKKEAAPPTPPASTTPGEAPSGFEAVEPPKPSAEPPAPPAPPEPPPAK